MLILSVGFDCWPKVFRSKNLEASHEDSAQTSLPEEGENLSDDDGLPPLEANLNRVRPFELHSDTDTDSDTGSLLGQCLCNVV
ncbi:hypothetical protein LIER_20716 [Lithospermum erythrorhizon]|uniref:Uncharacterized protein n=1 Tax=Lithospermum erythrorhizon TaxID=34254 RepID=A0AAV3QNX3_LITER